MVTEGILACVCVQRIASPSYQSEMPTVARARYCRTGRLNNPNSLNVLGSRPSRAARMSDARASVSRMSITPAQLAEWRRIIREEGALHSALAQRIAPMLLDEIERAWALLGRARREEGALESAALKRRLAGVARAAGAS